MVRERKLGIGVCAALALALANTQVLAGDCGSTRKGKDIVDTAIGAGSFNTLVAAVKAADLVGTLRSPGPFTVFAPTDEAFAKLPRGTLSELLEQPDRLAAILKYHVVPGRVMAQDVVLLTSAKTVLGQPVSIDTTRGVKINGARVLKTDINTSNGVIHVIDEVLLPPSTKQSNAAPQIRELIRQAINRGAPLFNEGHHAACTAVYEVAAIALLASADGSIGDSERTTLKNALASAERSHDDGKSAWIMRHALDEVYESASREINQ